MEHQPGDDKGSVNFRVADDSGVKYTDDNGWRAVRYYRDPQSPKVVQWVLQYSGGLVRDEKQAQYILLGFVAVVIATSLMLVFGGVTGTQSKFTPENFTPITLPTGFR